MINYEENLEEMILRDYLALDRTKLANERTLLSYIRSFIYFIVSGFGFIELTKELPNQTIYMCIGIALAAAAPVLLFVGVYRFLKMKKNLQKLDKK